MDRGYNGYANYETWLVFTEVFADMSPQYFCSHFPTTSEIKDACKDYAEQLVLDSCSEGFAQGLAMAFLSEVDWWDIADALISNSEEFEA